VVDDVFVAEVLAVLGGRVAQRGKEVDAVRVPPRRQLLGEYRSSSLRPLSPAAQRPPGTGKRTMAVPARTASTNARLTSEASSPLGMSTKTLVATSSVSRLNDQ
jgi:hypothetical protein